MPYKDPENAKANWRKWYRDSDTAKQARRDRKQRSVERNRAYVDNIKSGPCVDCGQRYHPIQMDFDHLPEYDKFQNISKMVIDAASIKAIDAEIGKCDLVCANCHRMRTYLRMGS